MRETKAHRRRRDTCAGCRKWRSKKRRLYRLSGARYCAQCGAKQVEGWNALVTEALVGEVRDTE